jgi:diguanylate cyclase (GGDEF)-like protein
MSGVALAQLRFHSLTFLCTLICDDALLIEGLAVRNPLRTFGAVITNERDLFRFVMTVSSACISIALVVDVVNQLVFFVDWATCLRSWAITTILVLVLAVPISRTIGRAHLELYREKMISRELSRTDHLTGLPNRRALMEAVSAAKGDALILVIADIDRFKRVNDTYGHLAGDEVINSVARLMAAMLGELGLLARVGGEEFALLSAGVPMRLLEDKLTAVRDRLATTPILTQGVAVLVTISAGVALARAGETFDQLYAAADRALYAAKAAGRNRVVHAHSIGAQGPSEVGESVAGNSARLSRSGT